MTFSPPHEEQVLAIARSTKPFNLWEGSIRSGKTFWSLVWLIEKVMTLPQGDGMLMGQTAETIDRNFLLDFIQLLESGDIPHNHVQNKFVDVHVVRDRDDGTEEQFVRRMWIVGAKDKGAIKRVRGSTLMIAYIDELTMMPQTVFDELVGRLSFKESILLATTNPDSPHHWVLKNYVEDKDKREDWSRSTFIMDHNLSLSPEYKERMKRQYSGIPARYQRMILGKWVMADGLIYEFLKDKHVVSRDDLPVTPPMKYHVAGDYGTKNPTVFGLIAQYPHPQATREMRYMYVLIDEYYYDGRKSNVLKTTSSYLKDFRDFISHKRIASITLDPSATPLIAEFEQAGLVVTPADNSVLDGINMVGQYLANGGLYILDECENTIEEFSLYSWDEVAQTKGVDRPIKEHDHAMDMLRYFIKTHCDPSNRGGIAGVSGW